MPWPVAYQASLFKGFPDCKLLTDTYVSLPEGTTGDGNGYPLQYPCLENLIERDEWLPGEQGWEGRA